MCTDPDTFRHHLKTHTLFAARLPSSNQFCAILLHLAFGFGLPLCAIIISNSIDSIYVDLLYNLQRNKSVHNESTHKIETVEFEHDDSRHCNYYYYY